jgi:uncharacterized protein with FMN-binding domain
MKKLAVSAVVVGVFILYCLMRGQPGVAAPSGGAPTTATDAGGQAGAATPASGGATGAPYRDGSYTGSVADAQWGYVQVKAIIQNGKITDVQWLQYPNDRERSILINSYADPQLTSEAIQAQSAQVDAITGATDSSDAFMQSLTDALSQAQGA